jgi:error-prone DNA polymerase
MTATLITYRARMAVRDAAKALGWPMDIVNKLSKAIPGFTNKDPHEYRPQLAAIVGDAPLLDTMLTVVELLLDRPRHLGLHSGGMILSSKPLTHFTPVQRSANGTSVVQFDKDDVEAMGLVKFDVLGLRMLACVSEALELIGDAEVARHVDVMRFDDPKVMDLIRSGKTLGLFQIESQGQMHLLAQHQPECFNDLITEVALFRPGPLQGGMVHPYVRRRRGLEPVTHMHPRLEPILADTLGIVLFQEQVLEIAHRFAGMPLDEADDFRALVSKNRDPLAMAAMREKFLQGAMACGVDLESAEAVYEKVSHFVGYGFCRSHAAAFARIVYQSAWLKTYHTAAYMAAFMQHRPGFYNLMTIEEEAKRFGVSTLLPDINRSGIRYSLERLAASDQRQASDQRPATSDQFAIRKPLSAIAHVTQDTARLILWERASGEFTSIEDLWQRVQLPSNVMDSIALSGALDGLEKNSRTALWKAGVLNRRTESGVRRTKDGALHLAPGTWHMAVDDIPELPPIKAQERLAYDYITHGAARVHPMTLYRRSLNELEIGPIESLQAVDGTRHAVVAGIVILRQSPPTAHGVLFVTLEDETGFVQCVVEPNERAYFADQLRHAALIVRGVVHARANWRGLVVRDVRVLRNVIGGYHGHPAMYGGTDTMELARGVGA